MKNLLILGALLAGATFLMNQKDEEDQLGEPDLEDDEEDEDEYESEAQVRTMFKDQEEDDNDESV